MIKICLVSPLPPPYGGISHWTQLVDGYSKTQPDISLRVVDTATRWREVHDLARWKRVVFGGFQLLRDICRVLICVIFWRPDVLHMTTSGQLGLIRDLAVVFIGNIFRIPVVYHIRFGRLPELSLVKNIEWRGFERAAQYSSRVIAIDQATFDTVSRCLPKVPIELIPNCFDPSDFSCESRPSAIDDRKTVVYLGWVIPTKGVVELIEAWKLVRSEGWRLVVVGPGDTDFISGLRRICDTDDVEFVGGKPHSQAIEIMRMAEVFVLPSYTEGFPNVVIEAMASGLPIIATSVGAIPEMIGDGRGVLVPPRDSLALASALRDLIDDSTSRRRIGELARDKAYRDYSIEAVFARYLGIWRTVSRPSVR